MSLVDGEWVDNLFAGGWLTYERGVHSLDLELDSWILFNLEELNGSWILFPFFIFPKKELKMSPYFHARFMFFWWAWRTSFQERRESISSWIYLFLFSTHKEQEDSSWLSFWTDSVHQQEVCKNSSFFSNSVYLYQEDLSNEDMISSLEDEVMLRIN